MRLSRLLPLAASLVAAGSAPSFIARSQDVPVDPDHPPAATLIVRGRVTREVGTPLPQPPGIIVLGSHWTYHIRVTQVIRGKASGREVVATGDADGALLMDRDFTFHLTGRPDGTYAVGKVVRLR